MFSSAELTYTPKITSSWLAYHKQPRYRKEVNHFALHLYALSVQLLEEVMLCCTKCYGRQKDMYKAITSKFHFPWFWSLGTLDAK